MTDTLAPQKTLSLSRDAYADKVYGGWLGKNAGNTLGAPVTGKPGIHQLHFYDPIPGQATASDDLDLQLVWLHALRSHGIDVTSDQLVSEWLDHVAYPWDEYGYAAQNFRRSLRPPLTGDFNNFFKHGLKAVGRSEIWAMIAPGAPQVAAAYAYRDAILDHAEEGVWAAMFWAAIESAAFFVRDPYLLLDTGLAMLPRTCRTAKAVETARDAFRAGASLLDARGRVLIATGGDNALDAPLNVAYAVLGWLYGHGDFGASVLGAVNCGGVTGTTGGMVGALLGIQLGRGGLPSDWIQPLGDGVILGWGVVNLSAERTVAELTAHVVSVGAEVIAAKIPTLAYEGGAAAESGGSPSESGGSSVPSGGTASPSSESPAPPTSGFAVPDFSADAPSAAPPPAASEAGQRARYLEFDAPPLSASPAASAEPPAPAAVPSVAASVPVAPAPTPSESIAGEARQVPPPGEQPPSVSEPLPGESGASEGAGESTAASVGNVSASAGDTAAAAGNVSASVGQSAASVGEAVAASGELPAPPGELPAPPGELPASSADLPASSGSMAAASSPEAAAPAPPAFPSPEAALDWRDNAQIKPLLVAPSTVAVYHVGNFEVTVDYGAAGPAILPNVAMSLLLTIRNLGSEDFLGYVTLDAPSGWQVAVPGAQGQRQMLARGGMARYGFVVRVPDTVPLGSRNAITLVLSPESAPALTGEIPLLGGSCWWVVGPFSNFGEEGYDKAYTVEDKPGLQEEYLGRGGSIVRWQKRAYAGNVMDLESDLFNGLAGVAYLMTTLRVVSATEAKVVLHTNDGVKAWLNGERILRWHAHQPFRPTFGYGQATADVVFRPGDNRIMVKCVRDTAPYAFSFALTDRQGRPLPESEHLKW